MRHSSPRFRLRRTLTAIHKRKNDVDFMAGLPAALYLFRKKKKPGAFRLRLRKRLR
ncbi:MAG: hypothetical protein AB1646_12215 [Thermodesulfobacteriota bacterium]